MNIKAKCPKCKKIRVFLVFEEDRIPGNKMGIMIHKCEECMTELPSKIPQKERIKRIKRRLKGRIYRAKKKARTIIGEFYIIRKHMKNLSQRKRPKPLPITFHTNTEAEQYMKRVLGEPAKRYYKIIKK